MKEGVIFRGLFRKYLSCVGMLGFLLLGCLSHSRALAGPLTLDLNLFQLRAQLKLSHMWGTLDWSQARLFYQEKLVNTKNGVKDDTGVHFVAPLPPEFQILKAYEGQLFACYSMYFNGNSGASVVSVISSAGKSIDLWPMSFHALTIYLPTTKTKEQWEDFEARLNAKFVGLGSFLYDEPDSPFLTISLRSNPSVTDAKVVMIRELVSFLLANQSD